MASFAVGEFRTLVAITLQGTHGSVTICLMNRIDRLMAILLLLQSGRRSASEIAHRFEVSKRTVFRDIGALCEMGVPIVAEAGTHGGYELMPDYSLHPLQLTSHETLLLRLALSSVSQLADTPFKQERESLLAKMQALMPAQHYQDTEKLLQTIQLDMPARKYAAPFIELLLESAQTGQWLCVSYHSQQRTSEQTILPRRLYCAGGFWYCDAYSQQRQEERTYRVDRFASMSPTQVPPEQRAAPQHPRLPYGHPSYPKVCIRLTSRGVLTMECDPHLGDMIEPEGPQGGGLLCFHCPPTEYDWLIRTLLSLGPDAEALAPEELREGVRHTAWTIANRYSQ